MGNNNSILYLLQNFLLTRFLNAYIIDVISDKAFIYSYVNNSIVNKSNTTYSGFLTDLSNSLSSEDLNNLTANLSIQRLEECFYSGKKSVNMVINRGGTDYLLDISLVNFNGNKLIMVIENLFDSSMGLNINSGNYKNKEDIRMQSMIDNVSDSLLKIYNVFNSNRNNPEVNNIGNYINTILSDITNSYPEFNRSFKENAISVSSMGRPTLLIVDDDMITRNLLKKIFIDQYNIVMATNGEEAISILEDNSNRNMFESRDNIVGIFLDLVMPKMDGFGVLDYLNRNNYLSKIPVAIISGDYSKETRDRVYGYHIADMLEKPFNTEIIKHRVNNLVNLYKSSNSLNEMILNQYADLKNVIDTIISAYKYDYASNIEMIKRYSFIIGTDIMNNYGEYNLDEERVNLIAEASCYYDIGYYAIPRVIYSKDSNFTKEEADIVKNYPIIGSKIVKYGLKNMGDSAFAEYAYEITRYYHERYDGTGYPEGLRGDAIPISACIVALSALFNNFVRSYSNSEDIRDAICKLSGSKFNPRIIESFKRVFDKLISASNGE
mgnify:FL=1